MALFGKRSGKSSISRLLEQEGTWAEAAGDQFGEPMTVRLRTDLDGADDRDKWSVRVGIAVPYQATADTGMPAPGEAVALETVEQMVGAAVGDRAIKAIVITMGGMREYVLYSRSAGWTQELSQELSTLVTTHHVRVVTDEDDGWSFYDSFFE